MDGESDMDLSSEQKNGSGGVGEPQCPEEIFEIESADEKLDNVQQNEDELGTDLSNGSKVDVPIDFIGPRMSISAKYFARADFVTEKCTAYNKILQPAKTIRYVLCSYLDNLRFVINNDGNWRLLLIFNLYRLY